MVNGNIVTEMGSRVSPDDDVSVLGKIVTPIGKRYFILNKPKVVLCVNKDEKGRKYVVDIIRGGRRMGLFPVGRLDMDTTGLIILTNDGELSNRIAHPRYGIEKEYRALVKGKWTSGELKEVMKDGVILENGSLVTGIQVISAEIKEDRTCVVIRIHEGRKHVVRRIFRSVGSRVYELHRTMIGSQGLMGLEHGEYREVALETLKNNIL